MASCCEDATARYKDEIDLDIDLDLHLDLVIDKNTFKKKERIKKKLNKIKRNLSEKEDVEICESPSKILCIQNGGLGNDVSQEDLFSLLSPFGNIVDIIMLPRKQFCYVCFANESNSVQALNKLNGHILRKGKDPSQDVILYFMFVRKAPSNVMPSDEKPPGLHIIEDFIDDEKENELLLFVNSQMKSDEENVSGQMKHRRVLHYGYEFKYSINDVDVNEPLPSGVPDICHPFLQKAKDFGLVSHFPDQLTINQYKPGQGIPPHVDTPPAFEDGIMSLSIGSQAVMEFRNSEGKHLSILLPRRSLLVMTGESRYSWSHGITPRKSDIISAVDGKGVTLLHRGTRTSFTFRKVVKDRCTAPEKRGVDSQTVPQTETEAIALEKFHVHEVYNDIADHFSGTRYKPWPRVVEFLMEQSPHSFLADVGCGNGKCLGVNKDLIEIGCDYSSNLASICHSRGFETCVADVTCLPLRSNAFDVVLCIAVIHHMATRERRIRAISEVIRILRVGGKALIYVWAMEQNLNQKQSKYINSNRQRQLNLEKDACSVETSDQNSSCDLTSNQSVNVISIRRKHKSEDCHTNCACGASDVPSDTKCDNTSYNSHTDTLQEGCMNQPKKQLQIHVNRTEFRDQDMLVPWKLKGKQISVSDSNENLPTESHPPVGPQLFHRYYHVFRQGELEALCKRVSNCVVCKSYYDQGNWCVVLEKVSQ